MKAQFKNYKISSTFKGDKCWEMENANGLKNWNNHIITVIDTETNRRLRFDFWSSIHQGYKDLEDEKALLWAFDCFLGDAISGEDSFEDFCSELGYDEDSRKAYKIWRACQRSADKFYRISPCADLQELESELREIAEAD